MIYGEFENHLEKAELLKWNDLVFEIPVGVAVVKGGNEYYLDAVNKAFLREEGYTEKELLAAKKPYTDYIYSEDVAKFEDAIEKCRKQKTTEMLELRLLTKEGGMRWELVQCKLYGYRDAVPYYVLTSWDVNDRKDLQEELRLLDEQYRILEEVTDEFPYEYDVELDRFRVPRHYYKNGKITDTNKRYMTHAEVLADICEEDREHYENALREAMQGEQSGSVDYRLNLEPKGCEPKYVWYRTIFRSIKGDDGKIIRMIGRSYDISSDREIREQLSEEMRLDPLTRVLNKVAAAEEVERFLAQNPKGTHVLFLIDIDDFKQINDTFGHIVGDTVILDIAHIIKSRFSDMDIVARVGGDEFLAFMKNTTKEEAKACAAQLCKDAEKRLIGDDAIVNVTLSIGLAVYGEDGTDYETLFSMADRAMYYTKGAGKNSFSFVRKGEPFANIAHRERKMDSERARSQDADKEFLNFAFSLLAHARDINGSLNVLIEQIGKRYGLDNVSVFEYLKESADIALMNYWSRLGHVCEEACFSRSFEAFENAAPGEFVAIEEEELLEKGCDFIKAYGVESVSIKHLAGIKFEFSGNRIGGLYLADSQRTDGFTAEEKSTFKELARVVGVFVSLRNKLSDDQKAIKHLKNTDMLTGLYNLEAFRGRMEKRLASGELFAESDNKDKTYAFVHVDVNNFSYVNENYGQQVGDSILQEYAKLIMSEDCVVEACRMYSDYFLELVEGSDREDVYRKIIAVNKKFEEQQRIKYPASTMRLSAGICFVEKENDSFDLIVEGANLARKQAKEERHSGVLTYKKEMRERRDAQNHITGRFYGALQKGELEIFLQPKFLLGNQKFYGAEALARWRTDAGEMLPPTKFIPALENMGYVVDLDFYILEQLLRAMQRWRDAGKKLFTVSTNFSRKNFENGGMDFIERLERTMQRYGIERKYIEIEVTESVVVENLQGLRRCLDRLEELGYRIAIDDFGTGYSSLSVLLEIPADVVKIDKSFTEKINLTEQQEFVAKMGQFIRSAKEEVIFEGIEVDEQRRFLMECGFNYGQGYLFDKPLPLEEFERKYI